MRGPLVLGLVLIVIGIVGSYLFPDPPRREADRLRDSTPTLHAPAATPAATEPHALSSGGSDILLSRFDTDAH